MLGIDRMDINKTHTVLFYNMGGKDTEVSLVRYSAVTDDKGKNYEQIEILAEAWDENLGGRDLDIVLFNMLCDKFNGLKEREGKEDIRSNPRAVKRLFKEVSKIKDVLSANKNCQVKISELADYVSLSTNIERGQFEDAAKEYFDKVEKPVHDVLAKAGLSLDDVDIIETIGGGIRVPKVNEILQSLVGHEKLLGVHLNGDEAMCFGSAFIASNSSSSFKVRKVFLTQHPQHSYRVYVTPLSDSDSESPYEIEYNKNYTLYSKDQDFLGQKKSLSMTYDRDMMIKVFKQDPVTEEETHLTTFEVKGINDVANNDIAKKEETTPPKVSLSFELHRSHIFTLTKVEVKMEET